jgi:hypothetical protein
VLDPEIDWDEEPENVSVLEPEELNSALTIRFPVIEKSEES